MMQVGSNPHFILYTYIYIFDHIFIYLPNYHRFIISDQHTDGAFPGDASGRPIRCEPERGDLPRADRHKSGQISSRPKTRFLGPQMVVKSKGNSSIFQGKPAVGEKLCNLARYM